MTTIPSTVVLVTAGITLLVLMTCQWLMSMSSQNRRVHTPEGPKAGREFDQAA